MLKKVIKLIPGFINKYLKNVTVEKNIKIIGRYYLDCTYELNILNLIPHLFFGDIFEIVSLGNDKRVFDDKRILMITEGFILLFVEKSIFEIQKLKLIFWGPIDSLSIIKQITGRNILELKWKAKKDKTTLMRLKSDKNQQIFDLLMELLNKKKIEYTLANESSGAKRGELPKIDIVAVEQEISKLEIKIKIKGKDGTSMDNTVQLMNLYEKAVQYYSALNDYRYQIYMRKTKKLFTNMSDKDLGFKKLEDKKGKKDEKKKKGKKGKKKKNKDKDDKKEDTKEEKNENNNEDNDNKNKDNNNQNENEENNINNEVKAKEEKKDEKKEVIENKKVEEKRVEKVDEKKEDKKEDKKEEKKEIKIEEPKKVEKSETQQKFEKSGFNLDLDDDDE